MTQTVRSVDRMHTGAWRQPDHFVAITTLSHGGLTVVRRRPDGLLPGALLLPPLRAHIHVRPHQQRIEEVTAKQRERRQIPYSAGREETRRTNTYDELELTHLSPSAERTHLDRPS